MRSKDLKLKTENSGSTKTKLTVLLCLLAFSFFANTLADSAAKAYEKKEFKQAISYYEKILSEGETSSSLYFNLGKN